MEINTIFKETKQLVMGLFDFLKKQELKQIEKLEADKAELQSRLERFKSIDDVDAETKKRKAELEELEKTKKEEIKVSEQEFDRLKTEYKTALDTYTNLKKQVGLYENKLDLIEYGVYEPMYDFETSIQYKVELEGILEQQKRMVSEERAATCSANWTIDGSVAKGKAATKKYIKLALRAFNGECESLIGKVRWNNITQINERILKSFESINKISADQKVVIEQKYLDLKLKELALEYEFEQKKQEEKEAHRAAQEALREEEKARKEFEQAQRDAEKEEATYEKALEKARKEVGAASGDKLSKLQEQIAKLELELQAAHEKKERALSMAQQTKRGHVYVISNIGSFGEQTYKIGMTRRLEPLDRIRELGDASVPFQFDIHAMIFSEDAPALENSLHRAFAEKKSEFD